MRKYFVYTINYAKTISNLSLIHFTPGPPTLVSASISSPSTRKCIIIIITPKILRGLQVLISIIRINFEENVRSLTRFRACERQGDEGPSDRPSRPKVAFKNPRGQKSVCSGRAKLSGRIYLYLTSYLKIYFDSSTFRFVLPGKIELWGAAHGAIAWRDIFEKFLVQHFPLIYCVGR